MKIKIDFIHSNALSLLLLKSLVLKGLNLRVQSMWKVLWTQLFSEVS